MSLSYENCEVCGVETIELASFRGLSLCSECDKTHEVVDNWTLVKKVEKDMSKIKYVQFFENYRIVVENSTSLGYTWNITVRDVEDEEIKMSISLWENGPMIGKSSPLPVNAFAAFDLANMYQEALALANTKNLTEDLLVELGYTLEE